MEKEDKDSAPSSSYGNGPPWIFKGRAMYQLHLVKSETARAFIPKELKLVEAFGYTLGGFFIAHYDHSPTGEFDELVVLSGIVWNPPTSCAWAARVLVNSKDACVHGRKEVGLPSQMASFTKYAESESHLNDLRPMVQLSLPSFSGLTDYNPNLLKYSCKIECRIKPVKAAVVSITDTTTADNGESIAESRERELNQSILILLSKPILALEFNSLRMQVEAPVIVPSSYSHVQTSLEPKM